MAIALHSRSPHASINITPMIDILLVILIIFMAIAPEKQVGLEAAVPRRSQNPNQNIEDDPVVLSIGRDGSYRLNSEVVGPGALKERLRAVFARRALRVLFLKAEGNLDFQEVAVAIDLAKGNVDRVALMP